jgi:hypothetical protein
MLMISVRPLLAVLGVLLLIACGSKLSEENFRKVQTGMSQAQVQGILGAPSETSSVTLGTLAGTSMVWKNDDVTISVQLFNDQVKFKTFVRNDQPG